MPFSARMEQAELPVSQVDQFQPAPLGALYGKAGTARAAVIPAD